MQYVISGTTSGTGNVVIRMLAEKVGAENITCLVRPTSQVEPLKKLGLRMDVGDVEDTEWLKSRLNPSVIYVDMTHPKHYHKSLDAVTGSGVERAFFVTTTGVFSGYHQFAELYRVNEAKIRASGITYTLLRPSMIYGSVRDKNMNRLIKFLSRSPVFPLFGGGKALMQPVFVEDLSWGIVTAILSPKTENQEYNLCGPRGLPYAEIVDTIVKHLNKSVVKLSVNTRFAAGVARFAQHIPGFPVSEEQVLRLLEDKVFDISKAVQELGYQPRSFDEGIGQEIRDMRAAGVIR